MMIEKKLCSILLLVSVKGFMREGGLFFGARPHTRILLSPFSVDRRLSFPRNNSIFKRMVRIFEASETSLDAIALADSSLDERALKTTTISSYLSEIIHTNSTKHPVDFLGRVHQLYMFKSSHGHTKVPKRWKENPSLGNWVNKQRQQYRKFMTGDTPCALTWERINILDEIGFCWNASTSASSLSSWETGKHPNKKNYAPDLNKRTGTESWWIRLNELDHFLREFRIISPSIASALTQSGRSTLAAWLRVQRKAYGENTLSVEQSDALSKIYPDWHRSPRELTWESRFAELQDYVTKYGDCCVPISYDNKKLANWVSNQRKQYNLRQQGKKSDMTEARVERLNEIGFVWNRWEYEFAKKDVRIH